MTINRKESGSKGARKNVEMVCFVCKFKWVIDIPLNVDKIRCQNCGVVNSYNKEDEEGTLGG